MLPSHVLSRDDAIQRMRPVFPSLYESFFAAWERLQNALAGHEDLRTHVQQSTRAGIVSDLFVGYAMPRLHEEHGARISQRGRMWQAVLDQQLVLRFKKVSQDLVSSNIMTQSQQEVYNQEQTLDGFGPLCSLTFAYLLDALGQRVTGLYLVCPRNDRENYWIAELWHEGEGRLDLFGTPNDLPDGNIAPAAEVEINVPERAKKEA